MLHVAHRVNSVKNLLKIPNNMGIEIDIRDHEKKLIVGHDPFKKGIILEDYLKNFSHKFIIANVKCEGIEKSIIKLFYKFKIKNFFLLDSTFPAIMRMNKKFSKHFCLRISEFETYNKLSELNKHCKWIWLDCFENINLKKKFYNEFKKKGFKICLVSPELHGRKLRNPNSKKFLKKIRQKEIKIDAICCKLHNFGFWKI